MCLIFGTLFARLLDIILNIYYRYSAETHQGATFPRFTQILLTRPKRHTYRRNVELFQARIRRCPTLHQSTNDGQRYTVLFVNGRTPKLNYWPVRKCPSYRQLNNSAVSMSAQGHLPHTATEH